MGWCDAIVLVAFIGILQCDLSQTARCNCNNRRPTTYPFYFRLPYPYVNAKNQPTANQQKCNTPTCNTRLQPAAVKISIPTATKSAWANIIFDTRKNPNATIEDYSPPKNNDSAEPPVSAKTNVSATNNDEGKHISSVSSAQNPKFKLEVTVHVHQTGDDFVVTSDASAKDDEGNEAKSASIAETKQKPKPEPKPNTKPKPKPNPKPIKDKPVAEEPAAKDPAAEDPAADYRSNPQKGSGHFLVNFDNSNTAQYNIPTTPPVSANINVGASNYEGKHLPSIFLANQAGADFAVGGFGVSAKYDVGNNSKSTSTADVSYDDEEEPTKLKPKPKPNPKPIKDMPVAEEPKAKDPALEDPSAEAQDPAEDSAAATGVSVAETDGDGNSEAGASSVARTTDDDESAAATGASRATIDDDGNSEVASSSSAAAGGDDSTAKSGADAATTSKNGDSTENTDTTAATKTGDNTAKSDSDAETTNGNGDSKANSKTDNAAESKD